MFTLDGAIEDRRARMIMIAHSKATVVFFRTSYHGHPGTSVFNRSIEGEYGHLKLGSYIYFPKGRGKGAVCVLWCGEDRGQRERRVWRCVLNNVVLARWSCVSDGYGRVREQVRWRRRRRVHNNTVLA